MQKVLCIGDIFLDILPSRFPIAKEKILHDGESFVPSITFQRGGCAGNFVAVLKSFSPEIIVQFISRTGKDMHGNFLAQEMKRYGVDAKFIRDQKDLSAACVAISFQDGERHFLTYLGALEHFTVEDIKDIYFQDVDHLAYRGIWFMEQLLEKCEVFLKKAAARRIPISMDLGFDPFWNQVKENPSLVPIIQKRKKAALNALQYINYLFGNEKELQELTDTHTLKEAIKVILEKNVKYVVIHRGARGAAIVFRPPDKLTTEFQMVSIPAMKVEVINPVGSGDTFDSIFISQILSHKTPIQAAALAAAGAAYSLQSPAGTRISLSAVISFLQRDPELTQLYGFRSS
jgi:sugar/nucleoside kinase (ribokinase family)